MCPLIVYCTKSNKTFFRFSKKKSETSRKAWKTTMEFQFIREGREVFRTHRTTALIQRQLGLRNQNLQGGIVHAVRMKRTVPSSTCRVGGVTTHRAEIRDVSRSDVRGAFRDTLSTSCSFLCFERLTITLTSNNNNRHGE